MVLFPQHFHLNFVSSQLQTRIFQCANMVSNDTVVFQTTSCAPCEGTDELNESTGMLTALQNMLLFEEQNEGKNVIPESFIQCLLAPADESEMQMQGSLGHKNQLFDIQNTLLHEQTRGVPQKPFYHELSKRLLTIQRYNKNVPSHSVESNVKPTPPFLPASHFGVAEIEFISSLIPEPPQQVDSAEECTKWLQAAGESGIQAALGMRRTVGTVSTCFGDSSDESKGNKSAKQFLFPPSIPQLLESSRKLHKPNTKSSLTVAARALAKHAHRGADGFFGTVKGSESEKNKHAELVVQRLIREAAWINIHAFGGVDDTRPVMEIRTVEGYGARWSAVWKKNAFSPEDILFRGFLEPNMDDGHENRWRH
mmetsp:Transcript_34977/g.73802  ORF Transcript_34977/g.73802 Transcript_34977/m.73802 type:complete len:367 (-) Transcript_34977:119-1219(-)